MLSNYDYHCPHCLHNLTNNEEIHFIVEDANNQRAHLYLNAEPGIYGYRSSKDLDIQPGDRLSFSCSSCEKNLVSSKYANFIEIQLKISDDIFFEVLFSPICGHEITYVVMEGNLEIYRAGFLGLGQQGRMAS